MAASKTPQWSSQWAFTLAAIGCSVGLGNLWRFSAEAGSNGGGAFIIVYLLCVLCIGIPALMAEYLVGRAGQATSCIRSMEDLATRSGHSRHWGIGVWIGAIAALLVMSFYAVVAAWVMDYIPRFLLGAFDGQTPQQIAAQFDELTKNPMRLMPSFLIFCGLTFWLVSRGVNRGIEMASKILMPTFFLLLVSLCIYSLITAASSGGTAEALNFMFAPDFNRIDTKVVVSALGQAFFSIGIGFAMMITYGSYLPQNISVPRSAFIVGLSDTGVALIAGMAIFPIVFHHGLDFNAGAGLFFETLPNALVSAPGGSIIGAAFFCMGLFAALTTGVALVEPTAAHLSDTLQWSKARSATVVGIAVTAVGFVCLFSLEFLDFLDTGLTAPIMLPLSALLVVSFVGWRLDRAIIDAQLSDKDRALGRFLMFFIRYVAPLMIAVILVAGIRDQYF
ncbi:MAG: sodium-dependent transporter [Gammaproteobacteria bacterium]|nr:sodium-dependent transporter [Gammaproteobacteria bacterium]